MQNAENTLVTGQPVSSKEEAQAFAPAQFKDPLHAAMQKTVRAESAGLIMRLVKKLAGFFRFRRGDKKSVQAHVKLTASAKAPVVFRRTAGTFITPLGGEYAGNTATRDPRKLAVEQFNRMESHGATIN